MPSYDVNSNLYSYICTRKYLFNLKLLVMVSVRINFKSHNVERFLAFSMAEAEEVVSGYDINSIISVHFYPNYEG